MAFTSFHKLVSYVKLCEALSALFGHIHMFSTCAHLGHWLLLFRALRLGAVSPAPFFDDACMHLLALAVDEELVCVTLGRSFVVLSMIFPCITGNVRGCTFLLARWHRLLVVPAFVVKLVSLPRLDNRISRGCIVVA